MMYVSLAAQMTNILTEIIVASDSNGTKNSLNDQFKQKLYQSVYGQQIFQELTAGNNVVKHKAEGSAIDNQSPATKIRVRTEGARVLRRTGQMKPEDFAWWRLIHHPDVLDRHSPKGKLFRRRFHITHNLFKQICDVMKPIMGIRNPRPQQRRS